MAPTENYKLDIIVGSNIGTLKHIEYDSNPNQKHKLHHLQNIQKLEKGQGITCLCWFDDDKNKIILGRQNNIIQTYDFKTNEFKDFFNTNFGDGKLNSIAKYQNIIIGAIDSGTVKIWKSNAQEEYVFDVGGSIEKMRHCSENPIIVATGGKENNLKLWDIEKKKMIFNAKNVPHDWLQLRVPIWISDICFLPENNGNLISICSRYGVVRLYDVRTQRRPVCSVEFQDQAASCISVGHRERHVIVGTGRGILNLVDLRMKGKLDKSYKGAVGAITDVICCKSENIVISTSLDRHLRIHNAETKQIIFKEYLTSRLSSLLLKINMISSSSNENKNEKNRNLANKSTEIKNETSDEEYEQMFKNMEVIKERKAERKLKTDDKIFNLNDKNGNITEKSFRKRKLAELETQYDDEIENNIKKLLKNTEKQKRKYDKEKKIKKAKSLFTNK